MKVNWLVAVLVLAFGCGGRVDQEEEAGDGDPPASTPPEEEGAEPPDEPTGGGTPLPGCEKGFDASDRDRPCNWMTKGYCYEEKLEACACACPRDPSVTSHCASGFPVEDGMVEVYCY